MSHVFVIGAAGQIGHHLVAQLAARGHRVRALHRQPGQATALAATGATPVSGDLEQLDATGLAEALRGSEVLVFTAGAGGKGGAERTRAIDGRGLELAVAAARQAGVHRFLLVSAFPEAGRGKHLSDTFEVYMEVKKAADVCLAQSGLDWVILRPGTLVDTPGTGRVSAGPAIAYGQIPREDVATTLVALVERPQVRRVIIELTAGPHAIAEALAYLEPGAVG
ncbi:NAD(P)H-binding protein [Stenotrophomonas sp. 24(2023)]|uniref:NAD(P)H-binding protein n=1 Tax=Stenotrophomonas sp. 24(2023) TaxID=3068324 RepID=UPI0027DF752E|nr:NAD(P)H-binding protein [Stenotrophomonas sp. 24(2023)]WMJ68251.1 NAD(P)H-binding protein [Stenotrophomonas sp. 24(2023)]